MGKNIVSKGKTVKEAVALALDLLSADKNEVSIEILENEKKGILGIGTKPAVVRITMLDEAVPNEARVSIPIIEALEKAVESLEIPNEPLIDSLSATKVKLNAISEEDELGGKVWVVDGNIFCKDAPDKYPLISPAEGMKLYKNDVLIEDTVIVCENDVLEVKLEDEVQEPNWEIELSDDKMEAILKVIPGVRKLRRIKDKSPDYYIQLEVEEKKIPFIIETNPIMVKLREMGIVHGVDYSEIANACTSDEAGSFIIARGTPATPGKHGYFSPIQQIEIKKGLKERSNGTIDFREIQEFPSVDRGQVIGVVIPPESGIPGLSVNNEPVFPPDVHALTVNAGRGVVLVEEGTKVVATDVGQPEVKIWGQRAQISVIPKLLIGTDVTLQTGNVRYIGDVEILGSVQDGMNVEANGNLLVRNNVNMANITAGSSIIVQNNIITSEVTAGQSSLFKAEISQILGELTGQMKQMAIAINQLTSVSAFKASSFSRTGLGPLIKILCDGRFKSFLPLASTLIKKIKSGNDVLEEEWVKFSDRLYHGFVTVHSSELRSEEDFLRLIKAAEELYALTQETQEENRFIKAGFVHNSQLYSSGDILVVGQGIYNSKLYAGRFVEVEGFVRGGEIYAAKGVQIGEVGTKGGTVTKITVPKSETIKINKALEDTEIQVGIKKHKFMIPTFHVHARLNEAGELIIS